MQLQSHPQAKSDIGDGQRILSAVGGSLLAFYLVKKHRTGALLAAGSAYLLYRAVSGHCPITAAVKSTQRRAHSTNINIRTSVIVNKPQDEVYAFWRSFENWPLFMRHLSNVDELDEDTSAWTMRLPAVGEVRWEARLVKDEPNTEISLTSIPGAPIDTTAKINFAPTPGNATRVDVMLSYHAPMGVIGERVSRFLTPAFRGRVEMDVANFKHFIENFGKVAK
jgi:uncharacterized membrane protein